MFGKPSLMTRIFIGKIVGLIIGLIAFFLFPVLWPEGPMILRIGILLWYVTFGAIIGVFGVLISVPILKIPFPWYVRAPFIGAWLNFVLSFFAYEQMRTFLVIIFGKGGLMTSPHWFALEGAILGFLVGFLVTKYGGEGPEVVGK